MARTANRYRENIWDAWGMPEKRYAVGIYSRLSVDQGDRKSESIENQIEMARQYIDDFNRIHEGKQQLAVYDTYIDRGISGTSFRRAGFARLMEDVRDHRVDCIIVKDLSRFGRDYLETGNYIEKILPFLGVRFIAVTDGFDSEAENVFEQKLAMNLKNLVNDMYATDISKRVSLARKLSAQDGGYIGGVAPYGYTVLKVCGVRKLQIHPENTKIVRFLFQSYAQGISCKEIISMLYERKVHRSSDFYKYGHTYWNEGEQLHQWSGSAIRGILANSVYIGKLEQGGKTSLLITMEHTHEGIIAPELFEKVQLMMERGKRENHERSECRDDENIFRNLLFCGSCGGKMHAVFYQSRINGRRKYAYYCRRAYYVDGRKCARNYISEEQILEYVKEQIGAVLQKEKLTGMELTALNQEEEEKRKKVYREESCRLQREEERFRVQAANLYMCFREGSVGREEYLALRKSKNEFEAFYKKRLEELHHKEMQCEQQAEKEKRFLRSLSVAGKRKRLNLELVEALIQKIAVSSDGSIDIYFLTGRV